MFAVIVALIIHWLFLFLWGNLFFSLWSHICLGTVMDVNHMTNTQWVITACKATQVDACRLLSTNYSPGHRRVNRPTELSAVPLNRLCCSLQLGLNVDEEAGRVQGPFPLCRPDRPLDSSAARQRASALQPLFRSSGRSHPGPWENKGVRLHLFSVSVPQGIKGEDISSRPAWLGPTHLRKAVFASLPPSFVHTSSRHGMWDSCGLAWLE